MIRCIIISLQRLLALQPVPLKLRFSTKTAHVHTQDINKVKDLYPVLVRSSSMSKDDGSPRFVDEEIVCKLLKTKFGMTRAETKLISGNKSVMEDKERSLLLNLALLSSARISKTNLIDYPWLITMENKRLSEKMQLLKSLHLRDLNHFVAFLRLSTMRLKTIVNTMNDESKTLSHSNRVYYISDNLGIDPCIVSKFLSKRLFVLQIPFKLVEQNLQHMIDYNVTPKSILHDLWAFRYKPLAVQERLERARNGKKEKMMPWMVRCTESILERSLKRKQDELSVLGDKNNIVEYLAERLDFSFDETKAILMRHKITMRVRATKIKEVLDYLLNEAGFTRHEIAQTPRILCHSLETTKKRLQELKSYNCRPSTLVIVCRSKRDYDKFLQHLVSMKSSSVKANATSAHTGITQCSHTSSDNVSNRTNDKDSK